VVCPLCEHSQDAGDACERCGRELVAAWDPPVRVESLAGLESGRSAPIPEKTEALQALEVTIHAPAPDASVFSLQGAETTQFAPAGSVVSQPVQGFDRGREFLPSTPFEAEAALTCSACGKVQRGMICESCGMRLPRYRPKDEEPDKLLVLCHNCNVRNPAGERCEGCGMLLPSPEE
jgi:hypothetical protein